ncbi:hypothetical protein L7F22_008949 [Adiantum nelumboides]|nr:hypothetical protein [Adiantum nelumboides]
MRSVWHVCSCQKPGIFLLPYTRIDTDSIRFLTRKSTIMPSLPTSFTAKRAVFVRKWAGFVSAIWLTIFPGCYVFPNYSTALKQVLGINQKLLNGISIAEDVGDSFGGIIGILSNHLPVWVLFCISASTAFLGYGLEWLVVSQSINSLPYWVVSTPPVF